MAARSTDKLIRVLLLPSWYPTARYPAGGIFCREQARALNTQEALDVMVLFVDRVTVWEWLRVSRRRAQIIYEDGVRVYRTAVPRIPGLWPLLYVLGAVGATWRIRRSFRFRPDVLHAHVTLPAGLAGVFIKRFFRIKLVLTEHTGPFSMLMRNRFAAYATRLTLHSADRVVAVSRALRDQIWAYPQLHRHVDIVPNVVDMEAFSGRRKVFAPGETKRLLFIGEMETSIKGVEYLLGAMSILKERRVEVQLDLVGQGRRAREYESLARALGVSERCRFLGQVSHEEVAELMARADAFVLPSLAETFGVVLAEAMAAGLPVVATRCGGPEEIVTPDVGVLVERANSAALADGIEDVLSRPEEFPEEVLRAAAENRYGQVSIAHKLLSIYRQVVIA